MTFLFEVQIGNCPVRMRPEKGRIRRFERTRLMSRPNGISYAMMVHLNRTAGTSMTTKISDRLGEGQF